MHKSLSSAGHRYTPYDVRGLYKMHHTPRFYIMGIKIKEWDIVWGINVTTIYSNPGLKRLTGNSKP